MRSIIIALLVIVITTTSALAADITGNARVIDGDTIVISKTHIRLYGIDAPEAKQTCQGAGNVTYMCGTEATKLLRDATRGQAVRCEPKDRDQYGRTVAICWAGPIELNRMMVKLGWAVAYRHYSEQYVPDEEVAHQERLGIWSGKFEVPAEWRREHRR